MPRIAGVDIPENKRVLISLTYIYGIGKKLSHDILQKANIDSSVKTSQLTDDEDIFVVGRINFQCIKYHLYVTRSE